MSHIECDWLSARFLLDNWHSTSPVSEPLWGKWWKARKNLEDGRNKYKEMKTEVSNKKAFFFFNKRRVNHSPALALQLSFTLKQAFMCDLALTYLLYCSLPCRQAPFYLKHSYFPSWISDLNLNQHVCNQIYPQITNYISWNLDVCW